MKRNGFLLLQSIALLTIGSMFLLTALRTYSECFLTIQKKLNLEKAIVTGEAILANKEMVHDFVITTKETPASAAGIILKEVQVSKNAKHIFSLTQAK